MNLSEKHLDLLESSFLELEKLKREVVRLEEIRIEIEELKRLTEILPTTFDEQFTKIKEHAQEYTKSLGVSTKNYLSGSNILFTSKLGELTVKTEELEKQITRLVDTDFVELFEVLQMVFIEKARADIGVELLKIDKKTTALEQQITRLVETDFVKLFKNLQMTFIEQTKIDLVPILEILYNKSTDFQTKIDDLEQQITRLVETDFVKLFDDLQNTFIEQTRIDLEPILEKLDDKSTDLQTKIDEFEKQITRLVKTDFVKLFESLQKTFIEQTRIDLKPLLKELDDKSTDLQTKIDELAKQVKRLEKIDLEKHFDNLQKTLSGIFDAINSINLTLIGISQSLHTVSTTLGTIQTTVTANHLEIKELIKRNINETEIHLSAQDSYAKSQTELLEVKIKEVAAQNEFMKKEMRMNRIIQIAGISAIIILLVYSIFG